MPFVRFLRTPSEAEAGPNHEFREGELHHVSARSLAYWLGVRPAAVIEAAKPEEPFEDAEDDLFEADRGALSPVREFRHAGRGLWHVYVGEQRITERAIPRVEAERLLADPTSEPDAADDLDA